MDHVKGRRRPVRAPARAAVVAGVLAVLGSGCNSRAGPTSPPVAGASRSSRADLRPVLLPDLTGASEVVAEAIRGRYASLTRLIDDTATSPVDLGNAYGELGKLLMAAQYTDASDACLLNAQTLAPSDMRWPYYLAHFHRTRGALASSAAFFEEALHLQAGHVPTMVWLADIYLSQGRPEASESILMKALSLQTDSVAVRFGLGRAALARKDYAGAVKYLEEALALDRKATVVHYPLAMAYRGLGLEAKANAHLELRRQGDVDIPVFDPLMRELDELVQTPAAYEVQGIRALDAGRWAAAAEYFRKGAALSPRSASMRHRLGTALFQMGDAQGALEQFQEAVRVSPEYAKAHYSLGVLMEASGRDNEALERYSDAVKYDSSYAQARVRLAGALRRSGRLQESLAECEQALKVDPRLADATFGYAMTLVRLERYREARDWLTEGMKLHPKQPMFAHALARLLAAAPDDRVRDGHHAMALLQELLKGQRSVDLGETMAMAHAELGQFGQAVSLERELMAAAKQQGGGEELLRHMSETLRLYEQRQPNRTPWRAEPDLSGAFGFSATRSSLPVTSIRE